MSVIPMRRIVSLQRYREMVLTIDFFISNTATPAIYTLSLHDALPIFRHELDGDPRRLFVVAQGHSHQRSEEHTSELQSRLQIVCRILLEQIIRMFSLQRSEGMLSTMDYQGSNLINQSHLFRR